MHVAVHYNKQHTEKDRTHNYLTLQQLPALLDTNTVRKEDGSLKVTIYQKPTHTDQYLSVQSNHPLVYRLSVVRTQLYTIEPGLA